ASPTASKPKPPDHAWNTKFDSRSAKSSGRSCVSESLRLVHEPAKVVASSSPSITPAKPTMQKGAKLKGMDRFHRIGVRFTAKVTYRGIETARGESRPRGSDRDPLIVS